MNDKLAELEATADNVADNQDIVKREITDETPVKRPHRLAYICPTCYKQFNQKHKYVKHLGRKTPCYEERSIDWLKANFDKVGFQEYLQSFEKMFTDFEQLANKAKDLDGIKAAQKQLKKIGSQLPKFKARVRAICHSQGQISKYDDELREYDERYKKLKDKYLLLLI